MAVSCSTLNMSHDMRRPTRIQRRLAGGQNTKRVWMQRPDALNHTWTWLLATCSASSESVQLPKCCPSTENVLSQR